MTSFAITTDGDFPIPKEYGYIEVKELNFEEDGVTWNYGSLPLVNCTNNDTFVSQLDNLLVQKPWYDNLMLSMDYVNEKYLNDPSLNISEVKMNNTFLTQ